jgi:hypothetical protein
MSQDLVEETPERPGGIPNANSPVLLTHMLEMVSRGLRSTRALQEALGVDPRTVRYYLQAGVWLGLLQDTPDPLLTPDGLAYVYAGASRPALYAAAVERQPFLSDLLQGRRTLPTDAELRAAIHRADPTLAPSTVERRASAVRGLLGPWLDARAARALSDEQQQLPLPLAQVPRVEPPPPLTHTSGRSFSPDVYAWILVFLLEHGELTLGHIRGLLDRAGADDVAIGGYVDLALERGDAVRVEERLVVTPAAISRRDVAAHPDAVILTDGGWRTMLDLWRTAPDKAARQPGRYRLWDQRLLGQPLDPATLEDDLRRALRDRALDAWPRTRPEGPVPMPPHRAPFLDVWEQPGHLITLPPTLAQLWEGVAGVNRRLRNARHRHDAVGTPTLAAVPAVAHGGLMHPGEPLLRSVADARSLRQRLLTHAPFVSLLVALLLVHRLEGGRAEVIHERGAWWVRSRRRRLGPVLEVLESFAQARGWLVSRLPTARFGADALIGLLDRTGLALRMPERVMLDDAAFHQLRMDEEAVIGARLDTLGRALLDHIEALSARKEG